MKQIRVSTVPRSKTIMMMLVMLTNPMDLVLMLLMMVMPEG